MFEVEEIEKVLFSRHDDIFLPVDELNVMNDTNQKVENLRFRL